MNKIVDTDEAIKISKLLQRQGKNIVVAGGVFDILHVGHIQFLEKAKACGDFLLVLLESDENAKRKKGESPINSQKDRAMVLSALYAVDYVVKLPKMTKDQQYDTLISQLRPDIIAATYKDSESWHKERQGKLVGAKVSYVIKRIRNQSTSKMKKLIKNL